jgi:hypothetical protein
MAVDRLQYQINVDSEPSLMIVKNLEKVMFSKIVGRGVRPVVPGCLRQSDIVPDSLGPRLRPSGLFSHIGDVGCMRSNFRLPEHDDADDDYDAVSDAGHSINSTSLGSSHHGDNPHESLLRSSLSAMVAAADQSLLLGKPRKIWVAATPAVLSRTDCLTAC